jgi:hypothetical protein
MTDWLYAEAGSIVLPDPNLCEKVKTDDLHPAILAFTANANRIHAFWALYPQLVEQASVNVVNIIETVFALTGRPVMTAEEYANPEFHKRVINEVHNRIVARLETSGGSYDKAAGYDFQRAVSRFGELINTTPQMEEAIYATFSAQLTSAWTAFEALASDLWEAAINNHPITLASLTGESKRISKLARSQDRDRRETGETTKGDYEPTLKDFARVTHGTYDASSVMGTSLREEFKFQTLAGIRKAYSAAFCKRSATLDSILVDRCLDKLNLVRNLIVHKAGIVDPIFLKGTDSIPWQIPLAEDEKPLVLHGVFVRDLIDPVFQCGLRLILAVDQWIAPTDAGDGS